MEGKASAGEAALDHVRSAEVLLEEAVTAPEVGPKCALAGGSWYSPQDDRYLDSVSKPDVDHLVPLAEAWDSGASAWTAKEREAYANDLDDPPRADRGLHSLQPVQGRQGPHRMAAPVRPLPVRVRHQPGRRHDPLPAERRPRRAQRARRAPRRLPRPARHRHLRPLKRRSGQSPRSVRTDGADRSARLYEFHI